MVYSSSEMAYSVMMDCCVCCLIDNKYRSLVVIRLIDQVSFKMSAYNICCVCRMRDMLSMHVNNNNIVKLGSVIGSTY
jgi:predicted component of viral defense system (DUF524 family)